MPSPTAAARQRTASATPAFLALGCVGAFISGPAFASDAPAAAPAANDGGQVQSGQDVLVNGLRERGAKDVAAPINTPRSVVVLPKKVIDESGSTTLEQALRTVPGITFGAAEGGNPIGDRPFIRGFDSQGSVYVDGVRDFASQSREVFAVDEIQIVRGSDSTLGGRGSAGGTINIISKLPGNDNFVSGAVSYGTSDYKRVTADVNQKLSDTVAARIEGVWHDQDVAGRDTLYQRRWGVAPSLTIGIGTPTRLTVSYYHLTSHEQPDSGIPYLYTLANAPDGVTNVEPAIGHVTTIGGQSGAVSRDAYYGLDDRDFRDTDTDQATMRIEHDFGGITLRNTSRYSHNSQRYIFNIPDDSRGNVFGTDPSNPATAGGYVYRSPKSRYGYAQALTNQTDLFGTFNTGGIRHSFALGAEVDWEKTRTGNYDVNTGSSVCTPAAIAAYYCTSLFNPTPYDPWVNYAADGTTPVPIAKRPVYAENQNTADTQAVYAFDSITLAAPLILNLGLRYDRFHTRALPGVSAAGDPVQPIERTDNLINGQIGVILKPTKHTSVYASFATSATPPNSLLGEGREDNAVTPSRRGPAIDPRNLKVQKTKSYEIGAKANLFGERLQLSVAAFQTETDNARVTGPNDTVEYIGKERIRGVEFSANGEILPGWTVFGGYTHLDPVITDGGFDTVTAPAVGTQAAQTVTIPSINTGRQAPQVARDSATLWTDLKLTHRLTIGGGAFYSSRVFGGAQSNVGAVQDAQGAVTIVPAIRTIIHSVPGYVRFDARLAYQLTETVGLSVNVQNLTDKTYFTQAYTTHYAAIAPGRSAFATLNFRF